MNLKNKGKCTEKNFSISPTTSNPFNNSSLIHLNLKITTSHKITLLSYKSSKMNFKQEMNKFTDLESCSEATLFHLNNLTSEIPSNISKDSFPGTTTWWNKSWKVHWVHRLSSKISSQLPKTMKEKSISSQLSNKKITIFSIKSRNLKYKTTLSKMILLKKGKHSGKPKPLWWTPWWKIKITMNSCTTTTLQTTNTISVSERTNFWTDSKREQNKKNGSVSRNSSKSTKD